MAYNICKHPTCRERVALPKRYCPRHEGEQARTYNKQVRNNSFNKKYADFYASTSWRKLRRSKLARDPLCEVCMAQGRRTPATIVHHLIELRVDYSRGLEYDNLQSICQACHNAEHNRNKNKE